MNHRPNHCGRHLEKINGHKSIYVPTGRCFQDEFYMIFMQPCLNKLLQSQAEVCVLVVNAKQVTKAQYNPFTDRATSHRSQFSAKEFAMHFRTSPCDVTDYTSV